RPDARAGSRNAADQASAIQRVVYALRGIRMEIHIEDFPRVSLTLIMTGVLPLTADARVPQGTRRTIHLVERRTQLAAMRYFVERNATATQAVRDRSEREQFRHHLDARLIGEP